MKPQTRHESETDNKAEEFAQLLLYALKNEDIARGFRNALGLQEQLADIHREVTNLRDIVRKKDHDIETLKKEVHGLQLQQDEMEQYSRRNSVRLSGLPERQNENVVELVMKVINVEMAVTPPVMIKEIDRMHRVGKPEVGRDRPILIKFATYRSRRRVIVNRRNLNPLKRTDRRQTLGDMLPPGAAADPQLPGRVAVPLQPDRRHHLFMNDDLTKTRAQLLYRCRVQKKDTKIADCWSSDGTILVKTLDHKITAVKSEADLASVCMQTVH